MSKNNLQIAVVHFFREGIDLKTELLPVLYLLEEEHLISKIRFHKKNKYDNKVTSIHKINHYPLVPKKFLTALELWVFLTQKKSKKKVLEGLR